MGRGSEGASPGRELRPMRRQTPKGLAALRVKPRSRSRLWTKGQTLKRYVMAAISLLSFLVLAAASLPASAASHADTPARATRAAADTYFEHPICQSYNSLC